MKGLDSKILLTMMLAACGIAAALGISQIWFHFLATETLLKALATILITGSCAGFLMAVDYDMPSSRQKTMLGGMALLIVVMAVMLVAQIWAEIFQWAVFGKIFGTVLILFVLVSLVTAIKEDFGGNKKLKDDNYLD